MKNAHLKMYKISKFELTNDVQGTVSLNFNSKVSYQVKHLNSGKNCEGILTLEVFDPNHPGTISATVILNGFFEIIGTTTKEALHIETQKELFTMAKTFLLSLSGIAGIKPILINDIDFDSQNVVRFNSSDIKRQLGLNKKPAPTDDTVDGPDGSEEENNE